MEEGFAVAGKAGSAVWHDAAALGGADLTAEVGLSGLAELTLLTLWGVKGNDVVSWLYGGDAGADGLDDAGSLVTENDWESSLWVLAREGVGILMVLVLPIS